MIKTIATVLLTALISIAGISQNEFTFKMYNVMDGDQNILFSPTSIKTAFAMAYEGANSTTQSEFEKVFDFKEDNSAFLSEVKHLKNVAEISNSVWVQKNYEVLESYIKKMKTLFDSKPYVTDFEKDPKGSVDKINAWIEKSTEGMIKDMLTPDAVDGFKMALVNAIYFKQNWENPFNKDQTKKDKFTNNDGSKTDIDLMHSLNYYTAFDGKKEKVIELPYEDHQTSMVIVLPKNMKQYKMDNTVYTALMQQLYQQKVNFDLPKFTFETPTFELKPYLKELGLKVAFTDWADFSGMREQKDLKIGTALHKAKIIVNEEGTEAAAATVIGMIQTTSSSSTPPPVMKMKVDKPFYYFIKDKKSNAILFMGKMNKM